MKIDTNLNYRSALSKVGIFLIRNRIVITSVLVLGVGVFVLQRINHLTNPEIDQAHLNQELASLQSVRFDEEAIEQISELENSSIDITSDFTNRDNPFRDN